MNISNEVLLCVFAMGAVILFCRAFPFLFFAGKNNKNDEKTSSKREAFLNFVEKIVPPAAMTVLAFNSIGGAFMENHADGFIVLAASVFTAAVHLWKQNALVSIFGGTALYMILMRVFL